MRLKQILLLIVLLILSLLSWSCDAINPVDNGAISDYSCEGCHTNKSLLATVIDDLVLDPPDEGHAAPG